MRKFPVYVALIVMLPVAAGAQATKNAYDNVHREEEFKKRNRVTVMPQAGDTVRHLNSPRQPHLKKTDSALHMHR